jgi:hypothetical protein
MWYVEPLGSFEGLSNTKFDSSGGAAGANPAFEQLCQKDRAHRGQEGGQTSFFAHALKMRWPHSDLLQVWFDASGNGALSGSKGQAGSWSTSDDETGECLPLNCGQS